MNAAIFSALGTLVVRYVQHKGQEFSEYDALRNEERARAREVFDAGSTATDSRLYAMERVYYSVVDKEHYTNKDRLTRWEEYRDVLWDWNSKITRTEALISTYFGQEFLGRFMAVMQGFESTGLHKVRNNPESHKDYPVLENLTALRAELKALYVEMLERIQSGNVGQVAKIDRPGFL